MDPQYIPQTHVTTTGSTFVNFAITPSERLRELTYSVTLGKEARGLVARVYRKSSKAAGQLSCDIYDWNEDERRWIPWKKDERKYAEAPAAPSGAVRSEVDGFEVWTLNPPTEQEIGKLKELIFVLRSKP